MELKFNDQIFMVLSTWGKHITSALCTRSESEASIHVDQTSVSIRIQFL